MTFFFVTKILQSFQNLEERCTKTQTKMNTMLLRADETRIRLGNTTNTLESLQNSQFVENRVYEEDETVANQPTSSDAIKKSPMTPMEAIQTAIDNSLNMMSACYEKVSMEIDDSDNEEEEPSAVTNVAYRPRDPYISHAVPHIIGTQEWKEKWHLGLVESDLETDEENEVADEYSSSSDDPSISVSLPSNTPTMSESDVGSMWGLNAAGMAAGHPPTNRDQHSTTTDDDEPEDNIYRPPKIVPTVRKIEIAADPDDPPQPDRLPPAESSSIFRQQQAARKVVNLFDDEPPALEIPPSSSTRHPNQRRPLNLLDENDDDDDDNDLFPSRMAVPRNVNLFDDSPLSDQGTVVPPIAQKREQPPKIDNNVVTTNAPKHPPPRQTITNIFGDSDDDGDDFMVADTKKRSPTPQPSKEKSPPQKQPESIATKVDVVPTNLGPSRKITNLFDDEPPDDDLDIFIQSKKSSSVSASLFTRPNKLFDDDDDDDFGFGKPAGKTMTIKQPVKV